MGALDGVLVVALEQAVAAPFCTARLAGAGARVIKVERPEGDFARAYDTAAGGESAYFVWLNRGKESIVLDLKDGDDLALLRRMIARADVYVQNLAPGSAARLGVGPEAMRARDPALVTCTITGYGEDGPYAGRKAYDLLIQAECGLASVTGSPEAPGRVGVSVCDINAGSCAYAGILEALIRRARTGEGRHVPVSLFDAMADWMTVPLLHAVHGEGTPRRVGLAHPSIAPYGAYAAGDGTRIVIAVQNRREWQRLCAEVLDRPALAEEARFADNPARVANRAALDRIIGDVLAGLDGPTLTARLQDAAIAYGRLNTPVDLAAHPALRRRPVRTPSGRVELPRPPGEAADGDAAEAVPALGAHSEALRREFAP